MEIPRVQFLAPGETLFPPLFPFNRLKNRMSFSKTITSLFLSILKVLKLISFFSLEMASRRLTVMTRSERDRIRWRNKSFAELCTKNKYNKLVFKDKISK